VGSRFPPISDVGMCTAQRTININIHYMVRHGMPHNNKQKGCILPGHVKRARNPPHTRAPIIAAATTVATVVAIAAVAIAYAVTQRERRPAGGGGTWPLAAALANVRRPLPAAIGALSLSFACQARGRRTLSARALVAAKRVAMWIRIKRRTLRREV
jgi:hypothetical protein